jgi:signal peptidase
VRLRSLLGLALLAAIAWLALPSRFGGHLTLVVVQGASMEPTYHSGDLLVAWASSSYAPGDVAVYRVPDGEPGGGHLIVHRLVRYLDDAGTRRWELHGDNRSTADAAHPRTDDLVGQPLADLGPFGTRLVLLLPFLLALVPTYLIGRALWPEPVRPGPTGAEHVAAPLPSPATVTVGDASAAHPWPPPVAHVAVCEGRPAATSRGPAQPPLDVGAQRLERRTELDEHEAREALTVAQDPEQQVVRPDAVVLQPQCLAQRELEHLLAAR